MAMSCVNVASPLVQKDSDAVKEALDQLREAGWAKQWASQPNISRRTVSILEVWCIEQLPRSY